MNSRLCRTSSSSEQLYMPLRRHHNALCARRHDTKMHAQRCSVWPRMQLWRARRITLCRASGTPNSARGSTLSRWLEAGLSRCRSPQLHRARPQHSVVVLFSAITHTRNMQYMRLWCMHMTARLSSLCRLRLFSCGRNVSK